MSLETEKVLSENTPLIFPFSSPDASRKCSVASVSRATPFVKSADDWAKRDKTTPLIWYNDLFFIGPLVLSGSLLGGILFYVFYNGWTVGSATFCATATLIGSIYGVPNQPDNVGAAFTIGYYVYGISLFTAIIGAIIGSMITRAPLISAEARRKIAQMEQPEDTDGDGEIGLNDYCFFLGVRFLDVIGWEEYQQNYLITAAALMWVVLGVLCGMFIEEWDFYHSVYFAMNAVSMAALADPPCENGDREHCDVGFFRGIIMSVYLLVGVPLFTLALAQLAGLVINRAVRENEYKIIHQPLTQDEYNYAANLYGNDEVLSLGEFTVLELLRLQRVSMEDLEHIKNLFCAIDEAETGMVDQPMLARRNLIHPQPHVISNGYGRDRAGSNTSSRIHGRRGRSRSCSVNSYHSVSRRNNIHNSHNNYGNSASHHHDRDSPPMMKIPSVVFDNEDLAGSDQPPEVSESDTAGGRGADGCGDWNYEDMNSQGSARTSEAAPEVPVSIRRMTIGQYNERVVPLAFTTLIENYEEEEEVEEEDGGGAGGSEDELSSKGFNTAAEEGNDEMSPDFCYRYHRDRVADDSDARGGVKFQPGFPLDSEQEEDIELANFTTGRMRTNSSRRDRPRKTSSRKERTASRRRGNAAAARDWRDLSEMEKGYKSEF